GGRYRGEHRSVREVQDDFAGLLKENALDAEQGNDPPPIEGSATSAPVEAISTYVSWLIDRDRKTTPLKSLQGRIWKEGYRKGDLRSVDFVDVPTAFERWREQEKRIYIYSSGRVLPQNLWFGSTQARDLTPCIC